jgi:hypothetical protein
MRKAVDVLGGGSDLSGGFVYPVQRRLPGPPLVNEELGEQRLSRTLALGVLSPDGISSPACGTGDITGSFGLATLAALRHARSLRPTSPRAVHFVIGNVRAGKLRNEWACANRGVVLDFIDCPGRRLTHCAAELVGRTRESRPHLHARRPRRTAVPGSGTRPRSTPQRRARKLPRIRR